jgi:hypothetical protein
MVLLSYIKTGYTGVVNGFREEDPETGSDDVQGVRTTPLGHFILPQHNEANSHKQH